MKFDYMRCLSCQHKSCIDCPIQDDRFKYIVKYTNIRKYWSLFTLIVSVSPLDGSGYFTLSMAKDILETEKLDDVLPREFWEAMAYFLSRKNHKLYLERKRKNARAASQNKRR